MKPLESLDTLRSKRLHPPATLTFAVTGACNLRCSHCWVDAGSDESSPHVPRGTVLRLIEEFAALGGKGIRLTGGEPLCHPDWLEILRFSHSLGFGSVALQTNAIRIGDDEVAALSELDFSGLDLRISIDGAEAATHDHVRGAGAFEGMMTGIERLVQGGLGRRITLLFTEMSHNLDEYPKVLELANRFGIGSVSGGTLVACGRGSQESSVAPPGTQQYDQLLERYEAEPEFRALYARIGNMAALEWFAGGADVHSECCTFIENIYLTAEGTLYPCVLCHADEYAVSRLFEKLLADALAEGAPLWSSLLQMSRSRAGSLAPCQECPGLHQCAGGCMGRAWGSSANLLSPDDRCAVRQMIFRRKNC